MYVALTPRSHGRNSLSFSKDHYTVAAVFEKSFSSAQQFLEISIDQSMNQMHEIYCFNLFRRMIFDPKVPINIISRIRPVTGTGIVIKKQHRRYPAY